jgi:hypothetical protein
MGGEGDWVSVVDAVVMGLKPLSKCLLPSPFCRPGDGCPFEDPPDMLVFCCGGLGVFAFAVGGRGVCVMFAGGVSDEVAAGVVATAADFVAEDSWLLRFRRDEFSFSAFSITTLAILSNSEQTPSMRCTPPVSASWPSIDRKATTTLMSLVSERALGSNGF